MIALTVTLLAIVGSSFSADLSRWGPAPPVIFSHYTAPPLTIPNPASSPKSQLPTPFVYKKGSKSYDDICGIENVPEGWIVGGQSASPNQFPWLALVIIDANYLCTASVIGEQWILTAAHCVRHRYAFGVFVGVHNFLLPSEPHRKFILSFEGIVHPDAIINHNEVSNDIALIKLPKSIEFNDYIRPACLPSYSDQGNSYAGENSTVTGWGATEFGQAIHLHYATGIPVITNEECKKLYPFLLDSHICTKTNDGSGTCFGDSGGPLNHKEEDGHYKQIGITSFLHSKCRGDDPHGFARVSSYLEFIETTTGIKINE